MRTYSIRVPLELPSVGIFMLYAKDHLHIWPKEKFYAGILSILHHTDFIDRKEMLAYGVKLKTEPLNETDRSE